MDAYTLSGGVVNTLEDIGTNIGSGNIDNIATMAWFIVVVVTVWFAVSLIYRGLRKVGF